MDLLLEILMYIVLGPIIALFEKPIENSVESLNKRKLPTWVKVFLAVLFVLVFVGVFLLIIFGALFLITGTNDEKNEGIIFLLTGLGILITYIVVVIIQVNIKEKHRKRKPKHPIEPSSARIALRRLVHVVVDRPLGSVHPEHSDIVYGVNNGFVQNVIGADGESQDAYILGVDKPITEFDGVVIAVLHRIDDNEYKWIVAPSGYEVSDEYIMEKIEFIEKYFITELIR